MSKSNNSNQDLTEKYKKKSHYEHIIDLPDTYIGSIQKEKSNQWIVCKNESQENIDDTLIHYKTISKDTKIHQKEIIYPPGLMNIIEEILVNAYDNHNRINQKIANGEKGLSIVTKIDVTVDVKTGTISIMNDGEGIDVAEHPIEKIYIPQMIFGELLTSGNYNKNEEKITGGKNGYGAKLTNIFSKKFIIETIDKNRKLHYYQEYTENMKNKHKPVVKKEKNYNKPYTRITFTPDYEMFDMEGLSDDIVNLIEKRTIDMAACSNGKINVSFNDKTYNISNFENYMNLYLENTEEPKFSFKPNDRWTIGICNSQTFNFQQVSFVNGINTNRGGRHVDYITDQICNKLIDYINKKKKVIVKKNIIKENILVFVNSTIVNPSFDSQTKETLTTQKSKFGSECIIDNEIIEQFANSGIMDRAIALSNFRDKQLLTKSDGKSKGRILDIEKLDDARLAGTKQGNNCTLILTEGDSAKAMAVAGISVLENGRDLYGIYPLRGKLLNTRDKNEKDVATNKEITDIKRIMGLKENTEYKDVSTLRYGRIMIMTDQDVDGSHIKGLIINFLSRWPSLIKLNGFITSLSTPIVKARKGSKVKSFYNLSDFTSWEESPQSAGWKIKYYKGLGTSTPNEAKEYFKDFKIVIYNWDEKSEDSIDLAFNKDRADDRKLWLMEYNRYNVLDLNQIDHTYKDFIDKDLIHFSNYDNERSIPNLCDGLKTSHRKIMFCCDKRNLKNEIRVAQLAGYVSEHGAYHHGEASLNGAIITLAQNYVGSNNINLLEPNGQFGSRLKGGKDSAQPRYIHTKLTDLTSVIYNKLDNPLLKYQEDDGLKIEPEYYMPIIPMVLVNGTEGIGTGWSSGVPKFNPLDLIKNIRNKFADKNVEQLNPWFRGFQGTVKRIKKNHWLTRGNYSLLGKNTIVVTELPIGVWTENFKVNIENLMLNPNQKDKKGKETSNKKIKNKISKDEKDEKKPMIKDYINKSSEYNVYFEIKFDTEQLNDLLSNADNFGVTKLESTLKLVSKISCDKKLNVYDEECKLQTFSSPEEIFDYYYYQRMKYYRLRKEYMLKDLKNNLDLIDIKVRFIKDIISGKIKINNVPKVKIIERLEELKYPKMYNNILYPLDSEELKKIKDDSNSFGNYDFLIKMPIYNLTKERVEELENEFNLIKTQRDKLSLQTEKELWDNDLKLFETKYAKFMEEYYKYFGINKNDLPTNTTIDKKKKVIRRKKK